MSTYLLLGRTGDILSILPFLKAEADAGEKPTLIVSNQFTEVLEGVSYVDVVPFDGGIEMLRTAMEWARQKYPQVKSLQVIGKSEDVYEFTYHPAGQETAKTTSFVKEYWKLAGHLPEWDKCWPLVFDKRSAEREAKLLDSIRPPRIKKAGRPPKEKPIIFVSCQGTSSPFPGAGLLVELLRMKFEKDFQVLELPKAERLYDLLGLYEKAHCLVATDSAPLHLAHAVPDLPVIAMTNDRPILWNGSPWMPQWSWSCRYHDWPERALEMIQAIENCRNESKQPWIEVWNNYDLANHPKDYHRRLLPIYPGACGRDSMLVLQDKKRIPYLKDCLRMGMQRANKEGLVMLRRPDVVLTESDEFLEHGACYSYRMTRNGTGETFAPVVDMFCAEKVWWESHLKEIPDFLFSNDYQWSEALRVLFNKHGGVDVTGACYKQEKA